MTMENLEIENEIEETDYSISTLKYRKKLIRKLSVVFICLALIALTRLSDKYFPFDVVMASPIFLVMLIFVIIFSLGNIIYLWKTKDRIDELIISNTHKKILNVFDLISVIPMFVAIISISNAFFISPATVVGASMEPNYYEGQDVLMWHMTSDYERFDVIVLRTNNDEYYIKRLIGLPGETVVISNNEITINGVIIEQEFLEDEFGSMLINTYCPNDPTESCQFDVPINSYFVLGDNREHSLDSRSNMLGFVDEERVYGTVVLKFNNFLRNNQD
jgi:signal peptidase I